ncbi:hypothetical protein GLOIN_2v1886109 [Rhizophagus clarus]|uniref:Uncharacterized protein n=1 Tax=Rhizophagus clarus TaxID=94130 RepID=A0A8H3M3M3_9GLOM|nr:hypothetical protein GLOIN_2v1886109 [Rhizophagus clarus]
MKLEQDHGQIHDIGQAKNTATRVNTNTETLENKKRMLSWTRHTSKRILCPVLAMSEKMDRLIQEMSLSTGEKISDTSNHMNKIFETARSQNSTNTISSVTISSGARIDKAKNIRSYSANEISKLTNDEIQKIIDHFTEMPNMDFTDDLEGAEEREEVVRVEEEYLASF